MRVHGWGPLDDGVAQCVDAAAARASCELRVLAWRKVDVSLAVVLNEFLQHDRARRHIDAQCKRFRSEDGADEPLDEELFYDVAERREHAGVVGGEAAREGLPPALEVEDLEVFFRDAFDARVDDGLDFLSLLRAGEHHARA